MQTSIGAHVVPWTPRHNLAKNDLKVDIMNVWCIRHESWIIGINVRFSSLIANLVWYMVLLPTWFRQLEKLIIHNGKKCWTEYVAV